MVKFACTTPWFKAKCFSLLGLWLMPSFSYIVGLLNWISVSTALRLRDRRRKGWKRERKGKSRGNFSSREGEYLRRPVRGGPARKGYLFQASGIWKGREICHLGLRKYPKGLIDEFYGFINSKKPSIFVIDSYLKDSVFKPVKSDAKF